MTTLISTDQFRKAHREGRAVSGTVFRVATDPVEPVSGAERTIRFCFSDANVDRMGDTIDPNGWDLTDFNRNPVALWAHDSSAPPIGRALNVGVEGDRLMGSIEFVPPETYAFADTIYRLVLGKFINAVSVGFLPVEYEWSKDDQREWGIDFLRQSLLEISVCPVPANPHALANARAKGIDTRPLVEWAERTLDGGGRIIISKTELQRLRNAAKEPAMKRRTSASCPRLRADGAGEDDPTAGGDLVGNCGRGPDEACGMKDPAECSVHAGARAADDDEEKRIRRLLVKILGPRFRDAVDGDPDDQDPPLAHEDSIRMAHKCLRTAKAFMTEGMSHHAKALDLLGDVVDALDDQPEDDKPVDDDPEADPDAPQEDKTARLMRARARRRALAGA